MNNLSRKVSGWMRPASRRRRHYFTNLCRVMHQQYPDSVLSRSFGTDEWTFARWQRGEIAPPRWCEQLAQRVYRVPRPSRWFVYGPALFSGAVVLGVVVVVVLLLSR